MTRAEQSRWVIVSIVSAVVVGFAILGIYITQSPHVPVRTTTNTPKCLVSLPASSQIGFYQNSTFYGDKVSFPNGTTRIFSYYSCPRPALGDSPNGPPLTAYNFTTNVFAMAAAAEGNRSFIAMENGSSYLFLWTSGLGCSTGTDRCALDLYFYTYGENVSRPCGPTSYARNMLGGILAEFTTTGAYVNGIWVSHGWDLSAPKFHALSSSEMMTYNRETC